MRKRAQEQAGFSLVELMIAMFVLAIGVLATMAMQFSSLAGYRASRDLTGAIEVARSVEQKVRAEALQWTPGQSPSATPIYKDEVAILDAVLSGTGWVKLNEVPVTARGGDGGQARFCPYVQGEILEVPHDTADDVNVEQDFIRLTIAVVYPAANGHFPGRSSSSPLGVCADNPGGGLNPGDRRLLEEEGLRATFISTAVRPLGQSVL